MASPYPFSGRLPVKPLKYILTGLITLAFICGTLSAAELRLPFLRGVYIAPSGGVATLPIFLDSMPGQISGFRICMAERGSDFAITNVEPGQFLLDCGWEYLNWERVEVPASIAFPYDPILRKTSGLIEITGFASVTAGYQPSCFNNGARLELVKLTTVFAPPSIYADVNADCMSRPFSFFWRDCFDNVVYGTNFDTLYATNLLVGPDWGMGADTLDYPYPGFGSPKTACDTLSFPTIMPMTAREGVYDIVCTDSVNPWYGDMNCDGYPFTIADGVAYSRYFVFGLGSLFCNPAAVIPGSDINRDGVTLTVADLVLLIKYTLGDGFYLDPVSYSSDFAKPSARPTDAKLTTTDFGSGYTYDLTADQPISACYLRLLTKSGSSLKESDIREVAPGSMIGSIGDTVTILWVDLKGQPVFAEGTHSLFSADNQDIQVVHVEVVDMQARNMAVVTSQALPSTFSLEQNVPNPFNPTTIIEYSLQAPGYVTLEVFNVDGQRVIQLVSQDQSAGKHTVIWNAVDQNGNAIASGLYFYRLQANDLNATKKMLLLK